MPLTLAQNKLPMTKNRKNDKADNKDGQRTEAG
jgi:hypothetical protein